MSEIWHHYAELITDPAHTLVETTFIGAELILGSVIWAKILKPRWERMLEIWHQRIDREHGHEHDAAGTSEPRATAGAGNDRGAGDHG